MTKTIEQNLTSYTTGRVLHSAALYDLLLWLVSLGRERSFREKVLGLARLQPGESVLDVGCGTGTLAIAAKGHVGQIGSVYLQIKDIHTKHLLLSQARIAKNSSTCNSEVFAFGCGGLQPSELFGDVL